MKKIILAVLTALVLSLSFSSCALLFDGLNVPSKRGQSGTDTSSNEKLDYKFKMTDNKISFIYYTSENKFSYTDEAGVEHNPCCYQISFNTARKTWTMYTRPVASTTTIEQVANGTYTSAKSPSEAGEITLFVASKEYQKIIAEKIDDNIYFNANVYYINQTIGASDAK